MENNSTFMPFITTAVSPEQKVSWPMSATFLGDFILYKATSLLSGNFHLLQFPVAKEKKMY